MRAPKRRSDRSERGPSSGFRSASSRPWARAKNRRNPDRVAQVGARPEAGPGWCDKRHPSVVPSLGVWRSWDRGCSGHRILGRVLVDGRRSRSLRRGYPSRGAFIRGLGGHSSPQGVCEGTRIAGRRWWRQERQRFDHEGTAGTKRPRSSPPERGARVRSLRRSAEVSPPWREPRGSLVKLSSSQELGGAHPTKAGTGCQKRARCGYT